MIYVIKLILEEDIDYIGTIESITYIVLNILLGVAAIKGFNYLLELRDKTLGATFNYWAQLKIRLEILKKYSSKPDIFANFCDEDIRSELGEELVDNQLLQELMDMIEELYTFLKATPDQMPAYFGWTDDIDKLCCFLLDSQYFDITKSDEKFKYKYNEEKDCVKEYREYISSNIKNIEKIIEGITKKQRQVEEKINKTSIEKAKIIINKIKNKLINKN